MKALVKKYAKKGLWFEDVPLPEVGINDALIKIKRTAICGTDMHIYNWDEWAEKTVPVPLIIGHEFVGEIVKIGSNVHDFSVGQIVSGEGHLVCGRCRNCLAGRRHLCIDCKGIGVNHPGAFAEYIAIPVANIWVHKEGIDLDIAALFDPLGNAVHTALQYDLLGEDVLITGAGPIGIMAAVVCKHAGARHVVITDVNPKRLDLAEKMGVSRAVNVKADSLEDVKRELGIVEGFDVALEMSGQASAFSDILNHACHGGKISVLGIPPSSMTLDWNKVIFNMLTIKGIYGREIFETWYKMSVMIESGLNILPIISHRLDHKDYLEGFEAMNSGEATKVILNWE